MDGVAILDFSLDPPKVRKVPGFVPEEDARVVGDYLYVIITLLL